MVCHVVRAGVDQTLGRAGLRAFLLRQRDAAFQGALQAAELLKELDRLPWRMASLDPGDLFG